MAEVPPTQTTPSAPPSVPGAAKAAAPNAANQPDPQSSEIRQPGAHEDGFVPHPTFWQQSWVQNILPLATSVAVHVGLLILGLIAVAATRRFVLKDTHQEQIIIPDSQLAQDDNFGGIPNPGMGTDPTQKMAQDKDRTSTTEGWSDHKNTDLNKTLQGGGGEGGDVIAAGEGNGAGHGSGAGGGIGAGLGAGNGTGGGDEAAFGPANAGGPSGPQSKIFGHGSNVKSIVYICDGTGSMVGGSKIEVQANELKKSISRLGPNQAFNVLQFQHVDKSKFVSFGSELIMATPKNKSKLFDFVENKMSYHAETNPIPALVEAFREHPQLIYLLTDGAFEDNDQDEKSDSKTILAKIAELNKDKKVHINTVLLLENRKKLSDPEFKEIQATMKKIADDNGGIYVPGFADEL